MSGIAEVLLSYGYPVQGSDAKANPNTARLGDLGAVVYQGHAESHIEKASVVVVSSAIQQDNPELIAARARNIPIVRRADMLAELMRLRSNIAIAGTHGKTTTTTLVAAALEAGGLDPTVINGGIIHAYGSNARLGQGEWMVVEADESDGSFNRLPATIAVINNIDREHIDHWRSFAALEQGFHHFAESVPFYGAVVACIDHPRVRALAQSITDRRVVTFGLHTDADVRARNVRSEIGQGVRFHISYANGHVIKNCFLPLPGEHNVQNALAAIAVAEILDLDKNAVAQALSTVQGVGRRFTWLLRQAGDGLNLIDDYAHHPVEIDTTLKAAQSIKPKNGRVIAIHQPHRYSRLHDLMDDFYHCFNNADIVAITDVFSAGEAAIPNVNRNALCRGLRASGHADVYALAGEADVHNFIRTQALCDDLVLCLGAGSISAWAKSFTEQYKSTNHNQRAATIKAPTPPKQNTFVK